MTETYRLKKYHRFYKKGNLVHYDMNINTYHNRTLAVFKGSPGYEFSKEYIISNPEIFEPVK